MPKPRPPDLKKEEEEPSAELQAVFGKSVRRQRLQLKWTQGDLAEHSGIGQEELSRIENGQVNITIKTMSRLARVLDGEVIKMLTRIETLSKNTKKV